MKKYTKNKIIFFKGHLSFEQINILLEEIQRKIKTYGLETHTEKRIYSISVEVLENILHHSTVPYQTEYPVKFSIEKKIKKNFEITVCNLVNDEQVKILTEKISTINSNLKNIRSIFTDKLRNVELSDKNGAGLGILIIGKNSNKKIKFSFDKISDNISYFCLKINIK